MSEVIGNWIITIQDRMPDDMRNSSDWKRLLPLAAGTGRDHEPERLTMIMNWMWASLELAQPIADADGFGPEWQTMCRERSVKAAHAAAHAAAATTAALAAYATAYAATAYAATAYAATAYAAHAAATAAHAAAHAAATIDWHAINPPALLERLINL
jgi:hypothetical protein